MTIKSESLDMAIELEEKGYNFYTEQAEMAGDRFARKVLKSLAEQELDHKKKFEQIAEGKDVVSGGLSHEDMENVIRGIFDSATEEEKKEWKEAETDVYEKALEMEKKTYRLYKEMAEETDNEEEKEFLGALMKEESKHEESIQNILFYLTDYNWWLADDESKTWNWMNI